MSGRAQKKRDEETASRGVGYRGWAVEEDVH